MKGLVVSGGGALGAWGGGVIQGLVEQGNHYEILVGTSTGSLMIPLVAIEGFKELKRAYTSVTQKSIFDVNPFNKNGSIKYWVAIRRLIFGKKTLGESNNLRNLIDEFFIKDTYDFIKEHKKKVIVCCVSMTTGKTSYFNSNDYDHEDIKDWVWISACAPVFMSMPQKEGQYWTDGGIIDYAPIQYAINQGATDIDIIIHKPFNSKIQEWKPVGILKSLFRVIDILSNNVYVDDINIAKLIAHHKDIKLNIYYMPRNFLPNSLVFNQKEMMNMWNIGYFSTKVKEIEVKKIKIARKKN